MKFREEGAIAVPMRLARLMDRNRVMILTALLALWLVMLIAGAREIDRELLLTLYSADHAVLEPMARFFTFFGEWWTAVAFTLAGTAWLAWRGLKREAMILFIACATGRLLVILEKAYFGRLRPEEHMRLVDVSSHSFPSGHASNAMMVYLGIALLGFAGRARIAAVGVALAMIAAVGLSRPMLGVHWPSDVVGGWAFGLFWLFFVFGLADYFAPGGTGQTLKRNSIMSPS